jgi:hypothetical protein
LRSKSKAPPFKERRTGHPNFNYKARATRPRSQQGDECLALRGFLMAGAPSLMPFKGGVLGLVSYARMSQAPIHFLF